MAGFTIRPITTAEEWIEYRKMCVHLFRTPNPSLNDESAYAKEVMTKEAAKGPDAAALGAFMDGRLYAAIKLSPYTVRFDGRPVGMSGIGDVISDRNAPERGAVKALFMEGFRLMKAQNRPLSHLHPFQMGYYRQYGYDVSAVSALWKVPTTSFKDYKEGRVEPYYGSDREKAEVQDVYEAFSRNLNMAPVKTEALWNSFFETHPAYSGTSFSYIHRTPGGKADAFMSLRVEAHDDRMQDLTCDTLWYASPAGLRGMLAYFASQTPYAANALLPLPEDADLSGIVECSDGWAMRNTDYTVSYTGTSRVVDAEAILHLVGLRADTGKVVVSIPSDPYCPWNEGTFELCAGGEVTRCGKVPDLALTPNALASLALGRYDAAHAALLPGVEIRGNEKALQAFFPKKPCWIDLHF